MECVGTLAEHTRRSFARTSAVKELCRLLASLDNPRSNLLRDRLRSEYDLVSSSKAKAAMKAAQLRVVRTGDGRSASSAGKAKIRLAELVLESERMAEQVRVTVRESLALLEEQRRFPSFKSRDKLISTLTAVGVLP